MSKKGEKGEKIKKPSEAEGAKAILEFLRKVSYSFQLDRLRAHGKQGNRPYSAQMVCDQLKNGLSKAGVEKVMPH